MKCIICMTPYPPFMLKDSLCLACTNQLLRDVLTHSFEEEVYIDCPKCSEYLDRSFDITISEHLPDSISASVLQMLSLSSLAHAPDVCPTVPESVPNQTEPDVRSLENTPQ